MENKAPMTDELGKVRWHCRRGLLEMDLILEKFNHKYLTSLTAEQLQRFKELLAFPDHDLLDAVMERGPAADCRYHDVLQLLRAA